MDHNAAVQGQNPPNGPADAGDNVGRQVLSDIFYSFKIQDNEYCIILLRRFDNGPRVIR